MNKKTQHQLNRIRHRAKATAHILAQAVERVLRPILDEENRRFTALRQSYRNQL